MKAKPNFVDAFLCVVASIVLSIMCVITFCGCSNPLLYETDNSRLKGIWTCETDTLEFMDSTWLYNGMLGSYNFTDNSIIVMRWFGFKDNIFTTKKGLYYAYIYKEGKRMDLAYQGGDTFTNKYSWVYGWRRE